MRFADTKDATLNGFTCLVHGEQGAGKTRLASTLVDGGHSPVIVSAEGGLLSLRDYSIPVIEVTAMSEVRGAYEFLRWSKEADGYDWVILDSLSEILEILLSDELASVEDPRQAYGAVLNHGMELVRAFRDLDKSVYLTAKQEWQKDEVTNRSFFVPSFPGRKLAQRVPYLIDEVFALRCWQEDGEVRRQLQTQADGQYVAKDRSGALDALEPADLALIAKKIHAKVPSKEG